MQIANIIHTALNILIPGICPGCNTNLIDSIYPICKNCISELSYRKYFSTKYSENIPEIYSCFIYAGVAKKCIKAMKYGRKQNILQTFYEAAEEAIHRNITCFNDIDLIVPVPLHPERKRIRGFNQSEILSAHISRIIKIPASRSVLLRTKDTVPQTYQNLSKRTNNLTGAFTAIPCSSIFQKNVLLVDDVVTTGSTLEACAKELLRAKAKSVKGFTIARTL